MDERIRYLLRQYENNKCSKEELEELFSYFRNSRNSVVPLKQAVKKVYEEICKNHPSFTYVDETGRLRVVEPELVHAGKNASPITQKYKAPLWGMLVVAAVVILSGVWAIWGSTLRSSAAKNGKAEGLTSVLNGKAEQKMILLPLNTTVWLNTASEIAFSKTISKEQVDVKLAGEAFFSRNDTTGVRLVIHTGAFTATVTGSASFNISAYTGEKEIIVSVNQGSVYIHSNETAIATLEQNQKLTIDTSGVTLVHQRIATGEAGAWRRNIEK